MQNWDFIIAPATVEVDVNINEVVILNNSLALLDAHEHHSGLHEWLKNTYDALTPSERMFNDSISHFLNSLYLQTQTEDYPTFINQIRDLEGAAIVEIALAWRRNKPDYPGDDIVMKDQSAYIAFMRQHLAEKDADKDHQSLDMTQFEQEWVYLQQPRSFLLQIADHLQVMWDHYLKAEWERTESMLRESAEAFRRVDYSNMSAYKAIETVTGRNLRGKDHLNQKIEQVKRLIFMPSPHLGPYISWSNGIDEQTLYVIFGARSPKNTSMQSTALSRSELLVRLNALSDENRLKILELLTQADELPAQHFINELNLSQSSASRHLRQLAASGYVSERRHDVAKYYSLNSERIDDTIDAIKAFLKKDN